MRALAALKDEGLIERVGLCNVNVGQIEEARRITDIAAVQVEVSVWHDENLLNGVVAYCIEHDIQLIAYRPLGGRRRLPQLRHESVLKDVAERHRATPAEIALAWLDGLSSHVVSIPGPTRVETVQSIVRAHRIELSAEDRERLDARFLSAAGLQTRRYVLDLIVEAGLQTRLKTARSCSSWDCQEPARARSRARWQSRDMRD